MEVATLLVPSVTTRIDDKVEQFRLGCLSGNQGSKFSRQ